MNLTSWFVIGNKIKVVQTIGTTRGYTLRPAIGPLTTLS